MGDAKYITATQTNFKSEVLESSQPVLVDFGKSVFKKIIRF